MRLPQCQQDIRQRPQHRDAEISASAEDGRRDAATTKNHENFGRSPADRPRCRAPAWRRLAICGSLCRADRKTVQRNVLKEADACKHRTRHVADRENHEDQRGKGASRHPVAGAEPLGPSRPSEQQRRCRHPLCNNQSQTDQRPACNLCLGGRHLSRVGRAKDLCRPRRQCQRPGVSLVLHAQRQPHHHRPVNHRLAQHRTEREILAAGLSDLQPRS